MINMITAHNRLINRVAKCNQQRELTKDGHAAPGVAGHARIWPSKGLSCRGRVGGRAIVAAAPAVLQQVTHAFRRVAKAVASCRAVPTVPVEALVLKFIKKPWIVEAVVSLPALLASSRAHALYDFRLVVGVTVCRCVRAVPIPSPTTHPLGVNERVVIAALRIRMATIRAIPTCCRTVCVHPLCLNVTVPPTKPIEEPLKAVQAGQRQVFRVVTTSPHTIGRWQHGCAGRICHDIKDPAPIGRHSGENIVSIPIRVGNHANLDIFAVFFNHEWPTAVTATCALDDLPPGLAAQILSDQLKNWSDLLQGFSPTMKLSPSLSR
eukprot:CAMPEP_0179047518 /NCGR_PEP_ID=MMETSP0796-20121207/19238_1 /TAXON_ID=73915 /ORGANISM="Pyrodinium bahamense, Strain pbaha01" /LENGTH=321 /DNA_ID=CAMNT_0020743965 /DNA_START=150 /DNA_END=1117 /DNA_ORIENTATION=-